MDVGSQQLSSPLRKCQKWWTRIRRKRVSKDHIRFEWKCVSSYLWIFLHQAWQWVGLWTWLVCGLQHHIFGDNWTIHCGSKINNKWELRNIFIQGSANITLPPTAHLHYWSSSNTPRPTSNSVNCHTPACDSQITSRTTNISSKPSFLELCVNTGPYLMSLAEIDTANILTDGDLFRDLRRQYLRLRRYRSRFWLLKPAAVSFVRVSSLIHVNWAPLTLLSSRLKTDIV